MSIRQIKANRSNAERSTGPKTAGGKAGSSQNALRHGLARRAISDPAMIEKFAIAIASGLGHEVSPESAMALAQSKLALLRLRSLRQAMLSALLAGPRQFKKGFKGSSATNEPLWSNSGGCFARFASKKLDTWTLASFWKLAVPLTWLRQPQRPTRRLA